MRKLLTVATLLIAALAVGGRTAPGQPDARPQATLAFEANRGQADGQVRFLARTPQSTIFLTDSEAVVALWRKPGDGTVLRLQLVGARPTPPEGLERLPAQVNYFRGRNRSDWRAGIPTYGRVRHSDVYPGIDVEYYGRGRELEYDFRLRPGADPSRIEMEYVGARGARLEPGGDLRLTTQLGDLRLHRPVAWQVREGVREPVDCRYQVDGNHIRMELAAYDTGRELVIDPVLSYSTYLGGSALDQVFGMAVDAQGSAFVTGDTVSVDFPVQNAVQPQLVFFRDGFVTRFNNAGNGLIYSTYLGGQGFDRTLALAVDNAGNAWVGGGGSSPDFPVTQGAFQTAYGGGQADVFALKLGPTGNLIYSTFIGGAGADVSRSVAVDATGALVLVGHTSSSDYPTQNPLQGALAGVEDAFVTKLSPAGNQLVFSTYLGGADTDIAFGVTLDGVANVYLAGNTLSPNFPLAQALQPVLGGGQDAFVAGLNAAGNSLVFSTYLGGTDNDSARGIQRDPQGRVVVAGDTRSPNFPTQVPFQQAIGGGMDAFVTRLDQTGTIVVTSTYLGGSADDAARSLAVAPNGDLLLAGITGSPNFPVQAALQGQLAGGFDAFLTRFAGLSPSYSSYLGGTQFDQALGVAVDGQGNAYLAGHTSSPDLPTANAFQAQLRGPVNGFVSKVGFP